MSTLARVIYSPDTTPPTTPNSVTATALSQTAIRITWGASTDTGGSGLAGYRVYRSTTSTGTYSQIGSDLTTSSLSYDDTGLSAGSTRYYRIVAFDGNANTSSQSATASATTTTGAGDGNDGLIVTNFSSYDPDAAQIISVDVNSTLSTATSTGASVSFATESWWSGNTGVATIRPPTIGDGYAGFNGINFWKNATKVVRQLNLRIEWLASAQFCLDSTQLPKLIILVCPRALSLAASVDRPMFYLDHMSNSDTAAYRIADSLVLCPAQGTVRYFSLANETPGPVWDDIDITNIAAGPAMRQPLYIRSTTGTDGAGNPIVAATEHLCLEMRVNCMSTSDEPNGVIGMRIYRRNGQVIERACAFTWWPIAGGVTVDTNYIGYIDVMGGGYFNNANSGDTNIWNKIGRRMTFGTNLQPTLGRYWMGPPQGFVQ